MQTNLLIQFKDYAIVMIDTNGSIQSWNMGAQYIYGYSGPEAMGHSIDMLYSTDQIESGTPRKDMETALCEGRVEYERWQTKRDGAAFCAHTILTALYSANGQFAGFALVTKDITSQKRLEEENATLRYALEEKVRHRTAELEMANKELEAFSYSVSHDLRAPLRAITGFSEILLEDHAASLNEEARRLLANISKNSTLMGQLIDDLLKFSRLSRLERLDKTVDMRELVDVAIAQLMLLHPPEKYRVHILALPSCTGDESMLKQVWMNLIDNALKYSSRVEDATIEIGGFSNDKGHTYFIRDNGVGFDMRYIQKLFGVFQRLHSQAEYEGTGLGLALVQRIIHRHRGEVWAEGTVGKGATFHFFIPKDIFQ